MITTPDGRPNKYAQIERERRNLLRQLPATLRDSNDYVRIIDRYLPQSALRLRRMESPNGALISLKLARKWVTPGLSPEKTVITNLYLTVTEYELLARLPAATLRKRRYSLLHERRRYSVDQFEGPLEGLVLAELHLLPEMGPAAGRPLPGCVREVTAEANFGGGRLAQLGPEEARAWVQDVLAGADRRTEDD
jgi:CYTH domain-containing protein